MTLTLFVCLFETDIDTDIDIVCLFDTDIDTYTDIICLFDTATDIMWFIFNDTDDVWLF